MTKMQKIFLTIVLSLILSMVKSSEIGAAIEVTESNWESLLTEGNHEWMIEL
jgi:hypothetical protein